ncbi:hypothetical protein GIS00_25975 [Nakamurella sp. YIM 132087]|uniref:Uncharacterized protein n=1 Tax=Nakamurella alba TaxID=2665158 RepID=A0A7K1FX30_9ACTN|nr:hypothetical protein [Nakamurella alba]MTD17384.1 hypothetical protein [Nakamurella alba]
MTPTERHRLQVFEVLARLSQPAVISHLSAAVLHGFPLFRILLGAVHVTRPPGGSSNVSSGIHSHAGTLEPAEVITIEGVTVTSAARTVIDCLRTLDPVAGLILLESAMHREQVTRAELEESLARRPRLAGSAAIRSTLAAADPASTGALWTRSRAVFLGHRGRLPRSHVPLQDHTGTMLGCADLWFPGGLVVVLHGPGRRTPCAVPRLDQQACIAAGLTYEQWTWADLDQPGELRRTVRKAIENAADRAEMLRMSGTPCAGPPVPVAAARAGRR